MLASQVAEFLLGAGRRRFLDATAGGGGHIAALLAAAKEPIEIVGIDLDYDAVERCMKRFSDVPGVVIMHGDFSRLKQNQYISSANRFDGVVGDFGQSSDQLDQPDRGMSFRWDAPIDMRFDQTNGPTGADVINQVDFNELVKIFGVYGGERRAAHIARAVFRARPLKTTGELANVIRRAAPGQFLQKTLSRCFMGLRVAVNREMEALERFLPDSLDLLNSNGRLAALYYDGSQGSIIKEFFRSRAEPCICPPQLPVCVCGRKPDIKILTPHPVKPSPEEIAANPRSRSCRMRVCQKL